MAHKTKEFQLRLEQGATIAELQSEFSLTRTAVHSRIQRLRDKGAIPKPSRVPRENRKKGANGKSRRSTAKPKKSNGHKSNGLNTLESRLRFKIVMVGGCRWVMGDPKQPDWSWCGEPLVHGSSYCMTHYKRIFGEHHRVPVRKDFASADVKNAIE
jgi:hypothetical protein